MEENLIREPLPFSTPTGPSNTLSTAGQLALSLFHRPWSMKDVVPKIEPIINRSIYVIHLVTLHLSARHSLVLFEPRQQQQRDTSASTTSLLLPHSLEDLCRTVIGSLHSLLGNPQIFISASEFVNSPPSASFIIFGSYRITRTAYWEQPR